MNTIFDALNRLYEGYTDGTLELAKPINLLACRMITSDVVDIRGELEKSACLYYNNTLTRVAGKVLIFRNSPNGKEVLLRLWRSAVYLPGGGLDIEKDGYDITNTIKREVGEEINLELTNLRPSSYNYWRYDIKPWVEKHVANENDRWIGYYTYLYTADYDGYGDNNFPEEAGRYTWHSVSDILARPDTKELSMIKKAIIENGYDKLQEDAQLTEGKQVGLVSYCIKDGRYGDDAGKHALVILDKILQTGIITASDNKDNKNAPRFTVSTSRDITGHLGPVWKCAIVLDANKLSDRYKIMPVDENTLTFYSQGDKSKVLQLRSISKYQAIDDLNEFYYEVNFFGNSFIVEISEQMYNIIKSIMYAYNDELTVKTQELGKGGKDKYKGRTNADVKKFLDNPPQIGQKRQRGNIPAAHLDHDWIKVEHLMYNVEKSGLKFTAEDLGKYKELILDQYGVDITTHDFFQAITGRYAAEAEERITAKFLKLVDEYGQPLSNEKSPNLNYGIKIDGCVKAILVNMKHKPAFTYDYDINNKTVCLADENGNKLPTRVDIISGGDIKEIADSINTYAQQYNIPIIFWNNKNKGSIKVD